MTMHNHAEVGEISERIVLVGDPNRAKYIAEHYLEDAVLVNDVRCAYCYTGMFEGVRVSVMAVGMGGPSMLIYATELCRDYGCKILVRAGTSGGYQDDMKNFDIVLSQAVSTTSGINDNMFNGHFSPVADFGLLSTAKRIADEEHLVTYVGGTVCNVNFTATKIISRRCGRSTVMLCLNRRLRIFLYGGSRVWMPGSDDGGNHNRNPL